jgi:hypothetical protein
VTFLGLSLLAATFALIPTLRSLPLEDLTALERFFNGQIIRRGVFSLVSMLALALAIIAALLAIFDATATPVRNHRALAITGDASAGRRRSDLSIRAVAVGFSDGFLVLNVRERLKDGERALLCDATTSLTSRSSNSLSCPKLQVRPGRVTGDATIRQGPVTVTHRIIRLTAS